MWRAGIGILLVVSLIVSSVGAETFTKAHIGPDREKTSLIVEEGKGKEAGLVKVTQIHFARPRGSNRPAKSTNCYKKAGWTWSEPVTFTVESGWPDLMQAVTTASATWDAQTFRRLFSRTGTGSGTPGILDGVNMISLGDYEMEGVIAVTYTWYRHATKSAVESDILFDIDFSWGNALSDPMVMDYQNIATHEIGHSLGLNDIYTDSCSAVTMYAYSYEGDTKKRTLETPDILGLQFLYDL